MTNSKTVLIWGREDILISSIEFILASRDEWDLVSIPDIGDIDALIRAVETTHADTVILHQGDHDGPIILPMQLLKDHPALRVITLSLENNSMDVYSNHKITVREASDLISVIDNVH